MIFLLLLQGERCRRGFLTRGCSAAFTEAVEAASAKAKSFLYKFFKGKQEAAQSSAFLFTFKRSTRSRSRSSSSIQRLHSAAAVSLCRCTASLLRGNSINAAAAVCLLLLKAVSCPMLLLCAGAAARGHRTAVSHARVPAADNNGRPSLPAGLYNNPSSC